MTYEFPTDTFDLTGDLVKLLRASVVDRELSEWEYGAAQIDPKRPYGNSDVERDIATTLGWIPDSADIEVEDEMRARAKALHAQTPMALQVVLESGSFAPGRYERKRYVGTWQRVVL
jgi:hypothetical protein